MDYLIHILILIGIYTILSVSLNLITGYTGLLSVSHAAFYSIGAYVVAIIALRVSSSFWINVFCAVILSGLFGALVAAPSLRLRDEYFVIATFAFQVITFSILNNWVSFTGGPLGISGIPSPTILGWKISSPFGFLILVIFFCALILCISYIIIISPFGRVLRAIREDEIFTQAVGKKIASYKIIIFVIGAAMAAIAGSIYAYYITFIDPSSFTIMESIFIISIVIIGGAGSIFGSVAGAAVLVILPELLRFFGLPNSIAANIRQILYGILLIIFVMWRPQGLLGQYIFKKTGV